MTRLDRRELRDLARLFVLANTPYSLYQGLMQTESVRRLRKTCTYQQLKDYYDWITARPRRTEIDLGFAYSVLVALLTADQRGGPIDTSRLRWGREIEELVQKSAVTSHSSYLIQVPTSPITITRQNTSGLGLTRVPPSTISDSHNGESE